MVEISHKREPSWSGINVWEVEYKVYWNKRWEVRKKLVIGLSSTSGCEMEAFMSVAAVYGGRKIKALSARFLGTGVLAGHPWELQKKHWQNLNKA
jgi:hypothetical protein